MAAAEAKEIIEHDHHGKGLILTGLANLRSKKRSF
jgi:hypothetical protein